VGLGVSRAEERELRRYRQFYQTYPQIRESLTPELTEHLVSPATSPPAPIRESVTPESCISRNELVTKLLFTHIADARMDSVRPGLHVGPQALLGQVSRQTDAMRSLSRNSSTKSNRQRFAGKNTWQGRVSTHGQGHERHDPIPPRLETVQQPRTCTRRI
jgi:hypothetical protein